MKKLLSIVLSLLLVFSSMIVSISAHDDCLSAGCELHIEDTSAEEIQPRAIVCGHNSSYWEVVGYTSSYHSLRCSICGATDDYAHSARTKCEYDSCSVCNYNFPFVNHSTQLSSKCLDDYGETHAYMCTNYWYNGRCSYYVGEESCAPYATGEIWYGSASNNRHRKYQECTKCGTGVYKGTVTCHKSIGETTCPYCD